MLEVYFEDTNEANLFYQFTVKEEHSWKAIRSRTKENIVQITNLSEVNEEVKNQIAFLLSKVFIRSRELWIIRDILKKKYYFSDMEEIKRISEIAVSILDKDEPFYEDRIHQHELRDTLTMIFKMHLSSFIRYDSIIHFRLHHYLEQLTDLLGHAIDEFKREEEYQAFIQSIREFLSRKLPEEEIVYVLQGPRFHIYRANGEVYSFEDLQQLKDRFPLFILDLPENEWDITPLIMLAPAHIYFYGDEEHEPRTHTIMNIFQDNLTFYPKELFPFYPIEEEGS